MPLISKVQANPGGRFDVIISLNELFKDGLGAALAIVERRAFSADDSDISRHEQALVDIIGSAIKVDATVEASDEAYLHERLDETFEPELKEFRKRPVKTPP